MRGSILLVLMLVCGTANATMYSCVDRYGAKTLRNDICQQGEKQSVIEFDDPDPYSAVNSTGEVQHYERRTVVRIRILLIPDDAGASPNAACEKRRKEIEGSSYEPTSLAGALVKDRLQRDYERDCLGAGPYNQARTPGHTPDASFTGEYRLTSSGEFNCRYSYAGQYVWKLFRNFCPSSTTGASD